MTPTRYSGNPVIPYGGAAWYASQVQEPIVFQDPSDSTKLIMYLAGMAAPVGTGTMSIGRATATAANPTSWTVTGQVFTGPGAASIRLDSMQYVSGTWWMYYTNVNGNNVGLAKSTDGFTFNDQGAVLSASCSGESVVSQFAVLKDGSTWRGWYSYRTSGATLPGIRYATSSDGVSWTSTCTDLLSVGQTNGPSTYIEWHQIMKIGSTYMLSIEGYDGGVWKSYLANSTSPGSGWAWSQFGPTFAPNNVEEEHVATPGYYVIGGNWYLFYQYSTGDPYTSNHWNLGMTNALPGGENPTAAIP